MELTTILLFVGGAVLLILGAEFLVKGASRLALSAGISPLVVGLTVVAFGTSAPELAVTVGSAVSGEGDVALGNVVGSNIFNVLFILGLAALIAPLTVSHRLVRLDVPLVIAASFLTLLLTLDGTLGRADGAILFAGIIAYTVFLAVQSRQGRRDRGDDALPSTETRNWRTWAKNGGLVAAGLTMLILGSGWLVQAAVDVASDLGVSELVIGLTVVAAGTSLPEIATSVLASVRGQRDIAVGNIVGSNLFNLLAVLGLGSLVAPQGIAVPPGALTFDLPVMIAVAVVALPLFFTGYLIARWEGAVLLGYYVVYTTWLVLEATTHPALHEFRQAMVWFVLPLTGLTIAAMTIQTVRRQSRVKRGVA